MQQNVIGTSWLPEGHRNRYDNGTPAQLSSALRRTWRYAPTSERIVEDISRLPEILDMVIEHKGQLAPDFEMQHGGCSKRKRNLRGPSRIYKPPPEVAKTIEKRQNQLKKQAKEMTSSLVKDV